MQIHIQRDGQQMGPYTLEQINGYLATGSLLPTDFAWHEGLSQWLPLNEIAGVISGQAATPQPPPFDPSAAPGPENAGGAPGFFARKKKIIIPITAVVFIVILYIPISMYIEKEAGRKKRLAETNLFLNDRVHIKDASLMSAIRESLNKPVGAIYNEDLGKVIQLTYKTSWYIIELDREIEDLKKLKNLKELDLSNSEMSHLDPLKTFTQLTRLDLRNCNKLTKAQIDELQKALPNCDILH